MPAAQAVLSEDLQALLRAWRRYLRALGRSPKTVEAYLATVEHFWAFLARQGMPTAPASITREHVEAYIAEQLDRHKPATALARFGWLQQWWRWLVEEEGELPASPMARMRAPHVAETPPPVLTDDDLRRLLKVCEGRDFEARRDLALLRLLLDTGMRRGECAGLRLQDLDLELGVAHVVGKGRRPRACPFGHKTAVALDRYLRVRKAHPQAARGGLWLGQRGALNGESLRRIVVRRAEQAGLGRVWPHRFRHTYAHRWLADGGQEGDLMRLAGWRSRDMLGRYGASAADERAREAYQGRSPGDKL